MRNLQFIALFVAVLLLCSCAPGKPAGVAPADTTNPTATPSAALAASQSAAPTASPAEQTPTAGISAAPTPTATAPAVPVLTPYPTVQPSKPLKAGDFMQAVSSGLKDRWAGSQAIVVCADGVDSVNAQMWLYERSGSTWKIAAGPWPADVGKNGVSKQSEGDGRSPSGAFLLGTVFGWAEKPAGMKYQYKKLDDKDLWVDDSSSPFYNSWVRGSDAVCGTGEALGGVSEYKYAMVVHYNDDAVNVQGSAIFMHVWSAQGLGTGGCTAVSEENMVSLLKWLDYSKRPVLVQGTQEQIVQVLQQNWNMLCLPQGWGFVDDFIPDAQREIRYNTTNNFTGKRLAGYSASLAPMKMDAIKALTAVTNELDANGLAIRIYDAYRPQKASDAMIAWAEDEKDTATKKDYYPNIEKSAIPGVYVAHQSEHRLGGTIDLSLLQWDTGKNLDMGGTFDFFGEVSASWYAGLTKDQANNRALLRTIMTKNGFKPYDSEWWHFTYPVGGDGGNFDILPRAYCVG